MLQPLRVAVPLPPPTLATASSSTGLLSMVDTSASTFTDPGRQTATSTATTTSTTPPPSVALTKVYAVEGATVPGKTKREKGASLYTIELYFCPPGRPNAMLGATWRVGMALAADRTPDKELGKTYLDVVAFADELKTLVSKCANGGPAPCYLCASLRTFFTRDRDSTPRRLNRAFSGTKRKCAFVEKLVGKLLYLLVRAQRRPTATTTTSDESRCCAHETALATRVAAFLDL